MPRNFRSGRRLTSWLTNVALARSTAARHRRAGSCALAIVMLAIASTARATRRTAPTSDKGGTAQSTTTACARTACSSRRHDIRQPLSGSTRSTITVRAAGCGPAPPTGTATASSVSTAVNDVHTDTRGSCTAIRSLTAFKCCTPAIDPRASIPRTFDLALAPTTPPTRRASCVGCEAHAARRRSSPRVRCSTSVTSTPPVGSRRPSWRDGTGSAQQWSRSSSLARRGGTSELIGGRR